MPDMGALAADSPERGRELNSWSVWRIDVNGNTFVVRDQLSKEEADRLVEEYTLRGHKQTYWAEQER
jgi:hypothetical protein